MTSKLLEQDTSAEKLYILNEYESSRVIVSDTLTSTQQHDLRCSRHDRRCQYFNKLCSSSRTEVSYDLQ